jgi:prepilin-type N-terminal cleavage/methylation domain-containing protein
MIRRHEDRDDGLGLIELIVAIVVSGILLAGIATIFVRSWQTQGQVISVSEATNRGQLVSAAIERAVRNGLYVQVSDSGRELRVSTSLAGGLKCQGFRMSSDTGGIARFSGASSTLSASEFWPEWETGILPQGSTAYFAESGTDVVTYTFQIETDSAPVRFAGQVSPRSSQEGTNDSCWS